MRTAKRRSAYSTMLAPRTFVNFFIVVLLGCSFDGGRLCGRRWFICASRTLTESSSRGMLYYTQHAIDLEDGSGDACCERSNKTRYLRNRAHSRPHARLD